MKRAIAWTKGWVLLGLLTLSSHLFAQTDSLKQAPTLVDTVKQKTSSVPAPPSLVRKEPFSPSPRRAALLSAVLPGAGQLYNRKYWKIPILYAGIGTLAYFIRFNDQEYRTFRDAYLLRFQGDRTEASLIDKYPDIRQLSVGRDYFRRNRDLLVIVGALVYVINIVDATVDAHFAQFNVNDDLSLSLSPQVQPSVPGLGYSSTPTLGLGLTLTFR